VALLDIGLPGGMDGYETARRLRAHAGGEGMVLAALTGHGSEGDRGRAREAGFSAHFVKPVDLAVLCQLLDQHAGAGPPGVGTTFACH
jgi:CheY-like chemotaxis protein